MPLPDPTFESAKGVFQLAEPSLRRPDADEPFISAVSPEFPVVMARQIPQPESPFAVPYLALNSSSGSSRLAVSALGAEFDVRFYGDFSSDRERCFAYLRQKLEGAMRGWDALSLRPALFGLVVTVNFPIEVEREGEGAVNYIVRHHTRYEVDPDDLQEAQIRVALKLDDTYFLTLILANYETKEIERAVFPGLRTLQVKPWEGEITGRGIQLAVDINNRLEAITKREDPVVDREHLAAMLGLSERVIARASRPFVESATAGLEDLVKEEA